MIALLVIVGYIIIGGVSWAVSSVLDDRFWFTDDDHEMPFGWAIFWPIMIIMVLFYYLVIYPFERLRDMIKKDIKSE